MLRFSLRRTKEPKVPRDTEEDVAGMSPGAEANNETVRVNYTSRTWLANLRKRTLSVESLSNMFSGVGRTDHTRRESLNSGGGSLTGGSNTKLLRTHKMQTKSGEPIEVYFGYDVLSLNGRSIGYADIVFWSHSASHFTMTYLSKTSGRRKDIVLYPAEKGPKPSDLTDMLGVRIAKLVADQTGCSEEKAMRMATAKANEAELREAVQALEQHQEEELNGLRSPFKKSSETEKPRPEIRSSDSEVIKQDSFAGRAGSGMIEVTTGEEQGNKPTLESFEGVSNAIPEGEEPQPTPL